MIVTLTFDNGPDVEETPKVLRILQKYGIRSTFFLVCNKLHSADFFKMAERAHDEGHWIGNHTLSHGTPLGLIVEPGHAEREIEEAQRLLNGLAHPDKFFRPNGKGRVGQHLLSKSAVRLLEAGKYTVTLWSLMPRDGTDPPGWPGRAIEHCLTRDWSSIVVHDRAGGGMDYLEDFILRVQDHGGTFRQEAPDDVVPIRNGRLAPWAGSIFNDDPLRQAEEFAK